MPRNLHRLAFIAAALHVAAVGSCGGDVVVDEGGGTSTGPRSSSASTGSLGGATASSSTVSVGATASSSTGTGTGGMPCIGVLNVKIDGKPKSGTLLDSLCDSQWNPLMWETTVGYFVVGGPPPGGSALHVDGCGSTSPASEGIHLSVPNVGGAGSHGAFPDSSLTFTDGHGGTWTASSFVTTIVDVGGVGQYIQASFDATVTDAADSSMHHALDVEFSACREPNLDAP